MSTNGSQRQPGPAGCKMKGLRLGPPKAPPAAARRAGGEAPEQLACPTDAAQGSGRPVIP